MFFEEPVYRSVDVQHYNPPTSSLEAKFDTRGHSSFICPSYSGFSKSFDCWSRPQSDSWNLLSVKPPYVSYHSTYVTSHSPDHLIRHFETICDDLDSNTLDCGVFCAVEYSVHRDVFQLKGSLFALGASSTFHISLFRGDSPGEVLVEFQRRSGDGMNHTLLVRHILNRLEQLGIRCAPLHSEDANSALSSVSSHPSPLCLSKTSACADFFPPPLAPSKTSACADFFPPPPPSFSGAPCSALAQATWNEAWSVEAPAEWSLPRFAEKRVEVEVELSLEPEMLENALVLCESEYLDARLEGLRCLLCLSAQKVFVAELASLPRLWSSLQQIVCGSLQMSDLDSLDIELIRCASNLVSNLAQQGCPRLLSFELIDSLFLLLDRNLSRDISRHCVRSLHHAAQHHRSALPSHASSCAVLYKHIFSSDVVIRSLIQDMLRCISI
eukprot:TRINITY_DN928_c0_g1_i6.p1 TRINITY_DN928_c0_g1~~TRINITY_DN928_c0_g1_i6.p1  ORF type:complete len:440 (+),score=97.64 TRINITY_DN928_c0_g1_i6:61-1380(+)